MKRIKVSTLNKKLHYWQDTVGLRGWEIKIRFVPPKALPDAIAQVEAYFPIEKNALISVREDYYKQKGYKISWCIDTAILHELIHLILWTYTDDLPKRVRENKRFGEFVEYLCDYFAKIIYEAKKSVKRKAK